MRFLIGIPVGTIVVCVFAFGNVSLIILLLLGSWLALREFWAITQVDHPGSRFPLSRMGEIATAILLVSEWIYPIGSLDVLLALLLPIFFVFQLMARARGAAGFVREVAVVALGVLYIGGFLSLILKLRNLQIHLQDIGAVTFTHGFFHDPNMIHFTLFPVLAGWCCDTAAFFAGKYFGKGKLAPTISPNKTVVGLVGGMVGSAAGVTLYAWIIGLIGQVQVSEMIAFGALAGAFSQLGDLAVSAIKREAGMKDTGKLMGAHGGLLDRIDGFLFALPATYLFFRLVFG